MKPFMPSIIAIAVLAGMCIGAWLCVELRAPRDIAIERKAWLDGKRRIVNGAVEVYRGPEWEKVEVGR